MVPPQRTYSLEGQIGKEECVTIRILGLKFSLWRHIPKCHPNAGPWSRAASVHRAFWNLWYSPFLKNKTPSDGNKSPASLTAS